MSKPKNLGKPYITRGYDIKQTNHPTKENVVSKKQTTSSNRKMYDFGAVSDYNGSFFQGTWNENYGMLTSYTPYTTGYSYIYWTKLPSFLLILN